MSFHYSANRFDLLQRHSRVYSHPLHLVSVLSVLSGSVLKTSMNACFFAPDSRFCPSRQTPFGPDIPPHFRVFSGCFPVLSAYSSQSSCDPQIDGNTWNTRFEPSPGSFLFTVRLRPSPPFIKPRSISNRATVRGSLPLHISALNTSG